MPGLLSYKNLNTLGKRTISQPPPPHPPTHKYEYLNAYFQCFIYVREENTEDIATY